MQTSSIIICGYKFISCLKLEYVIPLATAAAASLLPYLFPHYDDNHKNMVVNNYYFLQYHCRQLKVNNNTVESLYRYRNGVLKPSLAANISRPHRQSIPFNIFLKMSKAKEESLQMLINLYIISKKLGLEDNLGKCFSKTYRWNVLILLDIMLQVTIVWK